jgi:uncharacterized membrane protein
MSQVAALLFFLIMPAGVIYLCHHQAWAHRLGVIVICYGLGMAIGGIGVMPASASGVAPALSQLTVVLALPMLLFSLDMRQWSKVAGKAMLSLLFAVTAVTAVATALYLIYRENDAAANLAAMSVGVYSGGTPNLAAIKTGLEIPNEQYLIFHSLDAVVGSLYFLFMLTLGVPLFRALLGKPESAGAIPADPGTPIRHEEDDYRPLLARWSQRQMFTVVALSVLVVVASLGIAEGFAALAGQPRNNAVLIVAITTLGMLLSLHPRVRALTLSYRMGMYLIYVFCLAVASMVRFEELANVDEVVVIFLMAVVFGSLTLHALLCRLARVDGDTFMVTSVAAVASPPFVPLMARALNNPAAILPGMTTGIIGYALGSYLGISLGLFLRSLH